MSDDEERKKKNFKKEKKKEKKEKKRKEREEEKEKSKKSKKKNKVVKEDEEGETTTNAKIVGDFGLAKSGAPFKKKFYEPSESILRLSEKDVKERRDSLAITIENDGKKYIFYAARYVSRGWVSKGNFSCLQKFPKTFSHSSAIVANHHVWPRHGWNCRDWVWQDFSLWIASFDTNQSTATV